MVERPETRPAAGAESSEPTSPFLATEPADAWAGQTSLFGEAER